MGGEFVAFIVGLILQAYGATSAATAADAGVVEEPAVEGSTSRLEVSDLVSELRAAVEDYAEGLQAQIAARTRQATPSEDEPASVVPEAAPEQAPAPTEDAEADDPGCTREESSGEGWARSVVHCQQRETTASGGSSSIVTSSSNSVHVFETSRNDAP